MSLSTETNKAVVRRFYQEVFTQGKITVADEICSADYVDHDPTNPAGTLAGLKQTAVEMQRAFPDVQWTVDDLIAEGDKIAARVTMHGTQQGDLMGIPASGRSVMASNFDIIRFEDSKVVEHWGLFDSLGMLQQLGVIPAPGQATS
jgi:steroid delta-isomerase-like uncharacterized protein